MIYSSTAVYGGKYSMVNPVTCLFSLPLKHLTDAFKVQFSRASFYTLSKTLMTRVACRDMQLKFFKVETLIVKQCL